MKIISKYFLYYYKIKKRISFLDEKTMNEKNNILDSCVIVSLNVIFLFIFYLIFKWIFK